MRFLSSIFCITVVMSLEKIIPETLLFARNKKCVFLMWGSVLLTWEMSWEGSGFEKGQASAVFVLLWLVLHGCLQHSTEHCKETQHRWRVKQIQGKAQMRQFDLRIISHSQILKNSYTVGSSKKKPVVLTPRVLHDGLSVTASRLGKTQRPRLATTSKLFVEELCI